MNKIQVRSGYFEVICCRDLFWNGTLSDLISNEVMKNEAIAK